MNPSDVLGMATFGSIFLFFVWVCVRASKAINFDAFMQGVAWVILLAFVALVLIVLFQVGYPGQ
jgi:hypothetical protein